MIHNVYRIGSDKPVGFGLVADVQDGPSDILEYMKRMGVMYLGQEFINHAEKRQWTADMYPVSRRRCVSMSAYQVTPGNWLVTGEFRA